MQNLFALFAGKRAAIVALGFYGLAAAMRAAADDSLAEDVENFEQTVREKLWAEVYFEGEYSSHDHHNAIADGWLKVGVPLFDLRESPVEAYIKSRLLYDDNADYWNNRGEFGFGIRHSPFDRFGMVLFAELLYGKYYGREGKEKNPDDSDYWDIQTGFAFWQWWGRLPWEVEGAEFYLPFAGWREIYADGIYYRHEDHNIIGTLDYKEGLFLAAINGMIFDGYLNLEAGADKNADYWNNYAAFGPGIRWKPFESIDMNVRVEHFWGKYYRGDTEDESSRFNDFVIGLSLWKSW
jgi:hypothetical protein